MSEGDEVGEAGIEEVPPPIPALVFKETMVTLGEPAGLVGDSLGKIAEPDFLSERRLPLRCVVATGAAGSGAGIAAPSDAAFLPFAMSVTSHMAIARTFSSLPRKMGTVS